MNQETKINEETLEILHSMLGFSGLSGNLDSDIVDYDKVTERDVILKLVTKATKFAVQKILADTYAVLNMHPFPFREVGNITQTVMYDETKGKWIDDDLDMRYKWLQNIYKMLEEEAIKQGKLDANYKEQDWFLLYKNPPTHLKKLLISLSSQLSEYGTSLTEEIVIENFVKESNNEEIQFTLEEGYELFDVTPFPADWIDFVMISSIRNIKNERLQDIFYKRYPKLMYKDEYIKFLNNILKILKQEATTQGKL